MHITIWDAMPDALATWGPQATKINQAELHCGIMVAATFPELLRGRDVLRWIDNTSDATSMVKAGSPTESMGRLALKAHAMLAALCCRYWVEHVPSGDNPADVLSRDGLADPYVAAMCASGEWTYHEPVAPVAFQALSFDDLWGWGLEF